MSAERSLFVKICGLRDAASAQVAVDAGADALGFIFAPARRQIAPSDVASILDGLVPDGDLLPTAIGVTVNATPGEIEEIVRVSGVEAVQLSGDEEPSLLVEIGVPAIKALRFPPGTSLDDAFRTLDAWYTASTPPIRVIVEGHADGSYGGSGAKADWEFVAEIARRYPVVLAGGLTPENIAEAVGTVGPQGVDVSSGVETAGVKDHGKIRAFVRNARVAGNRSFSLKG